MPKNQRDKISSLLHQFPLLLDMVEEKVRSRCITVVTVFFIYIVLIFSIMRLQEEIPIQISTINVEIGLKNEYQISANISLKSPYPRVKLEATVPDYYLPDVPINIKTTNLIADQLYESSVKCSSQYRQAIMGTLEYYRLEEQCRMVLQGANCKSNSIGRCSYPNFAVERGPQGEYTFVYEATEQEFSDINMSIPTSAQVRSNPFTSYFNTNVEMIKMIDNFPPTDPVAMGVPLQVQPRVKLLDNRGRPISGKRVVAFSWPDQALTFSQSEYYIEANKFGLLKNAVSKPSDENGVAEFEGLTILGMSGSSVYIFLSVDNTKTVMWERTRSSIFDVYGIPRIRFPIHAITNPQFYLLISNNSTYSHQVTEGEKFSNPLTVQLLYQGNQQPVSNQLVFALLYGQNGFEFPFGYRLSSFGVRAKQLIRPIPGKYKIDDFNTIQNREGEILDELNVFEPIYTDSEGKVVFDQLMFSSYGPSGNYKIRFSCQGEFVDTEYITVKSKVKQVLILQQPPAQFNQEMQDINTQFIIVIQAVDEKGEGVEGKTPQVQAINLNNEAISNLQLHLLLNYTVMEPTDKDGFATLKFVYNFCYDPELDFKFLITVDGHQVMTTPVHFIDHTKIQGNCGGLIMTSTNIEGFILQNQNYFMEFFVFGENGAPLPNAIVAISNLNDADTLTPIPASIRPDCNIRTATRLEKNLYFMITDSNGVARFEDLNCDSGAQGQFRFAFLAVTGYTDSSSSGGGGGGASRMSDHIDQEQTRRMLRDAFNNRNLQQQQTSNSQQDDISVENDINFNDLDIDGDQALEDLMNGLPGSQGGLDSASTQQTSTSSTMQSKSQTEVKICVSYITEVRFITKISYIVWQGFQPDPNTGFHEIKGLFNLKLYDYFKKPLANYPLALKFYQSNVPGYDLPVYNPMQKTSFYQRYFIFIPLQNTTDEHGSFQVFAQLLQYKIGYFAFSFIQEGVVSEPIVFSSDFIANKISIVEQPPSNADQPNNIFQTGMYLKPAIVVNVTDKNGNPVPNYPVVANVVKPDLLSGDFLFKYVIFDHSSFNPEETLVVGKYRVAFTNASGMATFTQLTPAFTRKKQCLQFYFVTGDYGGEGYPGVDLKNMLVRSEMSNVFCFQELLQVSIINKEAFSKQISSGQPFKVPIVVRAYYKLIPDIGKDYIVGIGGILYELDADTQSSDSALFNPIIQTDNMFVNWVCLFPLNQQMFNPGTSALKELQQCSVDYIGSDTNYEAIVDITFNKMQWRLSKGGKFRLSFSSITNYASKDDDVLRYEDLPLSQPQVILDRAKQLEPLYHDNNNFKSIKQNLEKIVDLQAKIQNVKRDITKIENNPAQTQVLMLQATESMKTYNSLMNSVSPQIQDFINSRPETDQTPPIIAVSKPFTIVLRRQPPPLFYVRDLISLELVCIDEIGNLMQTVPVTAAIVPESTFLNNMQDQDVLSFAQTLGKGQVDIQQLSTNLKKSSNVILDPKRQSGFTNSAGVANLNLKILAGQAGIYCFQFESKGVQSGKSQPFLLLNHIQRVDIQEQEEDLLVDAVLKNQFTLIPRNYQLKIRFDNKTADPNYEKNVVVLVYKYVDYELLQQQIVSQGNSTMQSSSQIYSSIQQAKTKPLSQQDASTILNSVKENVMNSGKLGAQLLNTGAENLLYTFSIKQNSNRILYNDNRQAQQIENQLTQNLEIKDLRIQFISAGDYQLVFQIDGVDSTISRKVTVIEKEFLVNENNTIDAAEGSQQKKQNKKTIDIQLSQILENLFGFILIPAIIIVNISINHGQARFKRNVLLQTILLIFTILISFAFIIILFMQDNLTKYSFIYSYRIILVIFLLIAYIDIGLQLIKANTTQQNDYNQYVKAQHRKNESQSPIKESQVCDNEFNKNQLATAEAIIIPPTAVFYNAKLNQYTLYKNNEQRIMQQSNRLRFPYLSFYEEKINISLEYTYQLLFNRPSQGWLSRLQKRRKDITTQNYMQLFALESEKFYQMFPLKHIFYPYSLRRQCLSLKNSFFFPQRALAGIVVSLFACMFISYVVFSNVETLRESISNLGRQIQDTFIIYVSTATNYLLKANGLFSINEIIYQNVLQFMDMLQEQIRDFSMAIYISFIISTVIAILIYIIVTVAFLLDFRHRILIQDQIAIKKQNILDLVSNLIHQQKGSEEKDILINLADTYTSDYISTVTLGFVIIVVILALFLTPLCMPLFWLILGENLVLILMILISPIISAIIKKIEKQIVFDGNSIRVRFLHAMFEFFQIYIIILAGIFSAIVRCIKAAVISIFMAIIPFQTVFCQWVLNLSKVDKMYIRYLAMLRQYRLHNNPILISFCEICKLEVQKKIQGQQQLKLIRNKYYLLLFLYKNAHFNFKPYRKTNFSSNQKSEFKNQQNNKAHTQRNQSYLPLVDPEKLINTNINVKSFDDPLSRKDNYKLMN